MGAAVGAAGATARQPPARAPPPAAIPQGGVPAGGRARAPRTERLRPLAPGAARALRARGSPPGGLGRNARAVDGTGLRHRRADAARRTPLRDDVASGAAVVPVDPERPVAPPSRAARLAADGAGCVAAVDCRRRVRYCPGVVRRTVDGRHAAPGDAGLSHVGRARGRRPDRGRGAAQPARLRRSRAARGHIPRRPLGERAAARGSSGQRPEGGRSRGLQPARRRAAAAARRRPQACSDPQPPLGSAAVRPETIVVALGGNAVAPPGERPTIANQFRHTRESLAPIVDLARADWHIVLVHGNGPQVGDELARNELASDRLEPLPLGVLVAATAGWMGYMIQQSLQNALARAGVERRVVTVITQTLCDARDPDLPRPTKPIGHPLDPAGVARLRARGVPVVEEQPGRWRRLAPSPRPIAVVERDTIRHLVAAGHIVIACGGGGPPVYDDPRLRLEGLDAVADKDRVAAILGHGVAADVLLILTNVDAVYRAYGTPGQRAIRRMDLAEAEALLSGDELGVGSMRPKVEAAADFVRGSGGGGGGGGGGRRAVIAALERGLAALRGETGTTITAERG
ncbi:MAG: hypothetical protein DMD49_05880 [Gemmatimonadetes bacterium]|nr:MAG: hypothetical protein DMD49_05880 [Gemmatimonadota bacterium]